MKIGDKVAFSGEVIRRCRYSEEIAGFVGEVKEIKGPLVQVESLTGVKWIPKENLIVRLPNGVWFE